MKIYQRIAIAITQFINALTGGSPDETFCSRMWRKKQEGSAFATGAVFVLDKIFFFDPGHCKDSYRAELERRHVSKHVKNDTTLSGETK